MPASALRIHPLHLGGRHPSAKGEGIHSAVFWRFVPVLFVVATGCASGVYRAAQLPADLRIPPSTHGANLDLSRLAAPKEDSTSIGVGDVLEVSLVTGYEEGVPPPVSARVSEAGVVNIPPLGPVPVAGLNPSGAAETIARTAIERDFFRRPNVTVLIKEKYQNRVTVLGAVASPGVIALDRSSSDLAGALAMAGGLTDQAGTEIQIMRKNSGGPSLAAGRPGQGMPVNLASYSPNQPVRVSQRVDLVEATQRGGGDYSLSDGDVVMVNEKEPSFVFVTGLVREPKQVELSPGRDVRVLDAIVQAGGRQFELANKIHVIRRRPHLEQPVVIEVSFREAKKNGEANLVLGPNDIVSVEETPTTFVLGAIQQVLRFGVSGSVPLF